MNRILFLVLLSILSVFSCIAQEQTSGILYGPNWACIVQAPKGWIMDQDSWAKNNIFGLFYERGKKLGGAIPIIYINTQKLNDASDDELLKFIEWDTSNAAKDTKNIIKKRSLKLKTENKKIICYDFNINKAQFETIAYLRFKDVCFLVILATHDVSLIDSNLDKLIEVITNMKFIDKE